MDFKNKLIFAPLAGISDFIFREICKKNGADIVMSEMINVNGLNRLNKKTLDMLKFNNSERPFGLQIFGDDIKEFKQACIYIDKHIKPDFIDINCGCPVPKVVNHNAGAALLKNPKKIYEIIKSIKLVTKIPVTIKIRSGWDEKTINFLTIGKLAQKAGASAITLHARTKKQGYSGNANWDHIKLLKKAIKIPVIGNGDVKTIEDYKKIKKLTKCDSVMIGRGAIGNPWIFNNIKNIKYKENFLSTIKNHLEKNIKEYGEKIGILTFRTFLPYYFKGKKNSHELIKKCFTINSKTELLLEIKKYLKENN